MDEPLRYFYKKAGFNPSLIKRYAIGEKFFGLMLNNGSVGLCSNLGLSISESLLRNHTEPDLSNQEHRIVINAWLNDVYNYDNTYEEHYDIFDRLDFFKYRNIVMIGFFESLYEKFNAAGIRLKVFDRAVKDPVLEPISEMSDALRESDAVIITGTTIFNETFMQLTESTGERSNIFLVGPSNILHHDMLKYKNVKMVFGSVFKKQDDAILDQIIRGVSARSFLKNENKVYIKAQDFSTG
jgi:uncharacterized protein (DUF4213/DUF364 family)